MAEAAAERVEVAAGMEGIPQPGDVIGGKFVVEGVLGIGGMGVVVSARHVQLGQTVAIKFLRRAAATNPEAVNRFLREARASVGLQSAHVVRVMDVGTLDDGLPYMVMEHLNGTDLGQCLEVRRMLPPEEAVDYLVQAMDAVAEAHTVGIVHRDLKPSNLFLTVRPDGSSLVKVLDFGISKAVDGVGQPVNLTATTMVLGSPLYMSPEQVRSTKRVDTRTDVWALGVILYELIAGVPPFEAETVTGLCAKIVADPPVPLRSRRPEVSPTLEGIVDRCLDKDVTQRYRTVADLASALRPFASAEGKIAVDRITRMSGSRPTLLSVPETARSGTSGPVDVPKSGSSKSGTGKSSTGYAETVASWQTTGMRRNRRIAATAFIMVAVGGALAAAVIMRGKPRAPATQGAAEMSLAPVSALPIASAAQSAPTLPPPAASAVVLAPMASTVAEAAASVTVAAAAPKSPRPPPARAWTPKPAANPAPPPAKPAPDDLRLDRK